MSFVSFRIKEKSRYFFDALKKEKNVQPIAFVKIKISFR
jgi:hypothetical protein